MLLIEFCGRSRKEGTMRITFLFFLLFVVQLFAFVVCEYSDASYRCVRSGELVPLTTVCDNKVDCSDGSDESTCEDDNNHFSGCNMTVALDSSSTVTMKGTDKHSCTILVSPKAGERVIITSLASQVVVYDSEHPDNPLDPILSRWFVGSVNTTLLVVAMASDNDSPELTILASSEAVLADSIYLQGAERTLSADDSNCGSISSPCSDLQSAVRQRCTVSDSASASTKYRLYFGCPTGPNALYANCQPDPVHVIVLPGAHNISAFGEITDDIIVLFRQEEARMYFHLTSVAGPHFTSVQSIPALQLHTGHFELRISNLLIHLGNYILSSGCSDYSFLYVTESNLFQSQGIALPVIDSIYLHRVFMVWGAYSNTCQQKSTLVYGLPCSVLGLRYENFRILQRAGEVVDVALEGLLSAEDNAMLAISEASFVALSQVATTGIILFDYFADIKGFPGATFVLENVSAFAPIDHGIEGVINTIIRGHRFETVVCKDCVVSGYNNFVYSAAGIDQSLVISDMQFVSPGPIVNPNFNFVLIWGGLGERGFANTKVQIYNTIIEGALDALPNVGLQSEAPLCGVIVINLRCALILQNVSFVSLSSSKSDFLLTPYHLIALADQVGTQTGSEIHLENVRASNIDISGAFLMMHKVEVPLSVNTRNVVLLGSTFNTGALSFVEVANANVSSIHDSIANCTFRAASAIVVDDITKVNVNILDLSFEQNTALSGVFLSSTSTQARVTLRNSLLSENEATGRGGLVCCQAALVSFSNCSILQNRAQDGGVLFMSKGEADFLESHIYRNVALREGGVCAIRQDARVRVSNSTLIANRATFGGAFALSASDTIEQMLHVEGSELRGNNAVEFGGAVYADGLAIDGMSTSPPAFAMKDSVISQNSASVGGGGVAFFNLVDTPAVEINANATNAIDQRFYRALFLNSSDISNDNTASYGNVFGSSTTKVGISYPLIPQSSGSAPTSPLALATVDVFGQQASSAALPLGAELYSEASALLWQGRSENGYVEFSGDIMQRPDTRRAYVLVYKYEDAQGESESSSIDVQITTQPCHAGQYLASTNFSFDGFGRVCRGCPLGTYSLNFERDDATSAQCRACPANVDCTVAGFTQPVRNYWLRTNQSTYAALCVPKISGCEPDSVGRCTQQDKSGPMCLACVAGIPQGDGSCFLCGSNDALYTFLNVLLLVGGVQLLHHAVHTEQGKLVSLARILLTYLQMIFLLSSLSYELNTYGGAEGETNSAKGGLAVLTWFATVTTTLETPYLKCAFALPSGFAAQYLVAILAPIVFWVLHCCVRRFQQAARRVGKSDQVAEMCGTAAVLVGYLFQPWLFFASVNAMMYLIADRRLENADGSLAYPAIQEDLVVVVSDVESDFYSSSHTALVSLASIALSFNVLCLFLVFIVIASRGEKNKRTIMHFLSEGYRTELLCWEVIVFVRKMLLSVIVSAFVRREGDVQFATGLLLLVSIFSLGVHTFYMPYATASNNALEMLSLLGIIGVLFSFIMYLAAAILGEQGIAIATFVVLLLPNLLFLGAWCRSFAPLVARSELVRSVLRI